MRRLLYITGILFVNSIMVNAQNEKNDNGLQYTVDKQISSYIEITDRGVSSPKRIALKARHVNLERLLNLNDETHAILKDTLTDIAGGFHESCIEYYHGIEVEGTRYTIHYNKDGFPTMANGNFRTINNFKTVPSISESEALKSAINYVGAEKYIWEDDGDYPKGKLVVFFKDEKPYLAYKFAVHAIVPYSYQFIFINAGNGRFLESYSAEYPISSSVQTRYSGTVSIETQFSGGVYKLRDYSRGNGIETYNSLWQDYLSSNSTWTNMSTFDRSALDVHWGIEKTYDYYYNTFGRNSYDNNGGKLISSVNNTNINNAFWNTNFRRMTFGFFYDQNLPLVALDITAHEITHGVTQTTSGLVYQGESGALNEGMSDVFAVCVENAVKPFKGIY